MNKSLTQLQRILRNLFIGVCTLGFLLLGWQQTTTTRPSAQATHAVRLVKYTQDVAHPDKLSTFSPDKAYHPGDLVVKGTVIYQVQARPYGD